MGRAPGSSSRLAVLVDTTTLEAGPLRAECSVAFAGVSTNRRCSMQRIADATLSKGGCSSAFLKCIWGQK